MIWNLDNIRFLHPPDDFMGAFTNKKMQARHKNLQEEKIRAITIGLETEHHPVKAMRILNKKEYVQFLTNNIDQFKNAGCFEKTVLGLYYEKNTPFASAGDFATWKFFFESCDRRLLYDQGIAVSKATVTAYRGSVTGISKGFSWTVDRQKVAWFLDRWGDKSMGGGTIFSLEVNRRDILVFLSDALKQEIIVTPELAEGREAREINAL
jgi:hypothetical protein